MSRLCDEKYEKLVEYIKEHQNEFYRLSYSYTKNPDNAMDVVQNAICVALEKCHSLKNIEAIRSWFYQILINESLMFLRKHKKELLTYDEKELDKSITDTYFKEDIELYRNVQKLPESLRTIIILHFFEEMTLKEVSEVTRTNLNTVKSRLYKALRMLKVELDKEEYLYEEA